MKKHLLKIKTIAIVFATLALMPMLLSSEMANAFDTPAITITPGVLNIELKDPNQVVESELTINSSYSAPVTLAVGLSGVDDSSGSLVANGVLDSNLEQSLSLSDSQLTVPKSGSTSVFLKVTNSESLSPGGHYATVTLSQKSDDGSQVNLQSTISIGVYIVKRGGEIVDLSIANQVLKTSLFKLPNSSSLTFQNTGNILLTPRASVTIRSSDGKKLYGKGIANEGSLSVLPNKSLQNTFPIKNVSSLPFLPSKLKYVTEYRGDGVSNTRYIETNSWYIPPVFLLSTTLITVVLIALISKLIKTIPLSRKGRSKSSTIQTSKPQGELIMDIKRPTSDIDKKSKN